MERRLISIGIIPPMRFIENPEEERKPRSSSLLKRKEDIMSYYEETLKTLNATANNLRSEIKEQEETVKAYESEEDEAFRLVQYFEKLYAEKGEAVGEELDKAYADYEDACDLGRIAEDFLYDLEDAFEAVSEARRAIEKLIVVGL